MPRADAVVLAGGGAARLGGADKPALVVGECSLVASVVAAAAGAGARRVIVVGPARPEPVLPDRRGLRVVREDPPGCGPVPALRRGLAEVSAPWLLVLAADLPFIRAGHLDTLLTTARGAGLSRPAAGAVLADDAGRAQWLAGCWRTAELRDALAAYQGSSLHGLLRPLQPVTVGPEPGRAGPPPWLDCDTEEDVLLARGWLSLAPDRR